MGEIRPARLAELEPTFVRVASTVPIGEIRTRLSDDVRWVVVEFARPGRPEWRLAEAHVVRHARLDCHVATPVGLLPDILRPVMTVERTAQGVGEARWRAWRTRERVLVVVDGGRFAGLVGDPTGASTRGDDVPPLAESRFLRAKVMASSADPELRVASFAPGLRHSVAISIGPQQEGLLVAETPVPPEAIASAQMLKVTAVAPWITSEGQMFVPEQGASSDCVLDLGVPPPGVQRITILVFGATGLVQTATLVGDCTDSPSPDSPLALLIDASVWPRHLDAMPTLVQDVDRVVAAVPSESGFDVSGTADMEQASKNLFEDLEFDLQGLWLDQRALDDADTVDVLRKLARAGAALRDDLFDRLPSSVRVQFGGDGAIQLIVRDPAVDVPLELFYDAAVPHPTTSGLCPGAHEALRTGTCPHCNGVGARDLICPMGFWGLRRVIERRVLDPDVSGAQPLRLSASTAGERPRLESLDTALFARSARVEGSAADVLLDALREAGIRPALADNWTEWSLGVSGDHPPPLLIAMPHVDQTGREPRLEIGDDQLERVDISSQYVCFPPHAVDQPGPLVLLLGCETASAPVAHRTMTSKFLTHGASIVLGTRMPVVAEAAPLVGAAIVRSLMAQSDADDVLFGEAVRAARCQLVADGHLVALALVALGDGGWRVPTRRAA
jgi:hypothetical protein